MTTFGIVELPPHIPWGADGLIGWQPLKGNIFSIEAAAQSVKLIATVPKETSSWSRLPLQTNWQFMAFVIHTPDGKDVIVTVDTGSDQGVILPPETWRAWKAAHANQPTTLAAYYSLSAAATVVAEEGWAKEFSIGELSLTDVPVLEGRADDGLGVILGLTALQHLDLIVDRQQEVTYLHPTKTTPPRYDHNRLGAVFVPLDPQKDDLVARVVEGSPAWDAGIRRGDLLLKIGELDATKWRTDRTVLPLARFWKRPAGTSLDLTLRRGNDVFKAKVRLRQILAR